VRLTGEAGNNGYNNGGNMTLTQRIRVLACFGMVLLATAAAEAQSASTDATAVEELPLPYSLD